MSDSHNTPSVRPTKDLDRILVVADAALANDSAPRRPPQMLDELKTIDNISPRHRLTYRPQPTPLEVEMSQMAGMSLDMADISFGHTSCPGNAPDLSLKFLALEGETLMQKLGAASLTSLEQKLTEKGVHLLTCLDAASLRSETCHGELISMAAAFIEETVAALEGLGDQIWLRPSEDESSPREQTQRKLDNCRNLAFVQRLMFYKARLHGDSVAKFRADFDHLRKVANVPKGQTVLRALAEVIIYDQQEIRRINELWEEDVKLEWTGALIPVEDVSAPIFKTGGIDCTVCRYQLTPPALRTPCNHSYYRDCLQEWMHACQPAIHRCPYCRTQLFEKPDYRVKEPETALNYLEHRARHKRRLRSAKPSSQSWYWFTHEIKLQKEYEAQVAKFGAH